MKRLSLLFITLSLIGCSGNPSASFYSVSQPKSDYSNIDYDLYDFDWEYELYSNEQEEFTPMTEYTEEDWERWYTRYQDIVIDNGFVYGRMANFEENQYGVIRCCLSDKDVTVPNEISIYKLIDKNGSMTIIETGLITTIFLGAFCQCTNMETLRLGKNIASIDPSFGDCSSLTNIMINPLNDRYYIKDNALFLIQNGESILLFVLQNCNSNFDLDDNVYGIDFNAFMMAQNITDLHLGAHFHEYISSFPNMLNNLTKLKNITVSEDNQKYSEINGVLTSKDKTVLVKHPCGRIGDYVVPSSINKIDSYAFSYSIGLKKIYIDGDVSFVTMSGLNSGNNVEAYEITNNSNYASFEGNIYSKDFKTLYLIAPGKTVINVKEGTETIASISSKNVSTIFIPDSVKTIKDSAVCCEDIKQIVLGAGIETIGKYAFGFSKKIYNVEQLFFKGSVEQLKNVKKDIYNEVIATAQRYYYSEIQPTKNKSHFWHYVDNKPTVW